MFRRVVPAAWKTYLRVEREEPKVLVWVEAAGWWCLSLFLIRRVTPPSAPGMTPIACCRIVSAMNWFARFCECSICSVSRVCGVVGSVCGNVPCWQWIPHSISTSQPIAPKQPVHRTYLAAVQVLEVQRVARERNAIRPLDKSRAVSLCTPIISLRIPISNPPTPFHSLVISHARSPGIVAAILSEFGRKVR
jgi:hypothetical protein